MHPKNVKPHYRTRVIQNRQFVPLSGWRLFIVHYVVQLLTTPRENFRQQVPAICFTVAGLILFSLFLAFIGVLP
jgi:hypothetical protein